MGGFLDTSVGAPFRPSPYPMVPPQVPTLQFQEALPGCSGREGWDAWPSGGELLR